MIDKAPKIKLNVWLALIIFGLFGQIAWTIENMYLNVYIYKTVTYDPKAIAYMVSISGVIATLASVLAALIPAIRSSKLNPIDIIRNN